jgi:predicted N-acetyltransferase YhbS
VRPAFRTLARVDGEVVGQQSAFRIDTDPSSRLFGLGDVAVHPDHRGRGIARSLIRLAVEQARERGAEVILTDTVAVATTFQALGFRPVPRFSLYYERDGSCRWHPRWLAWGHEESRRLRLDEGDF